MRFFVTGATGLVGSHAVDGILAQGHSVRALIRRPRDAEAMRERGIDVAMGDLSDEGVLRASVEDADVVVHSAAAVGAIDDRDLLREVNVEGTKRLLAACVAQNVPRFVHVSSVAVYGYAPPPVREDAPKKPPGAYGASKWEAEQLVERIGRESNLGIVVLRPCAVYGERDRHAQRAFSRIAGLPVVPLARGGSRLFDLVHASDVASAVLAAASSDAALGHAYNITDGASHTHRDILMTLEHVLGRRPWIVSLPGSAFTAIDTLQNWVQYVNAKGAKRLGRLKVLDLDLHYSIEAARRDLRYEPEVRLDEGLKSAFAWNDGELTTDN